MNKNANVLAVMEHFADNGTNSRDRINAERARAAVAELIEACDHLKRDATNERWADFHAAIARVKGV